MHSIRNINYTTNSYQANKNTSTHLSFQAFANNITILHQVEKVLQKKGKSINDLKIGSSGKILTRGLSSEERTAVDRLNSAFRYPLKNKGVKFTSTGLLSTAGMTKEQAIEKRKLFIAHQAKRLEEYKSTLAQRNFNVAGDTRSARAAGKKIFRDQSQVHDIRKRIM